MKLKGLGEDALVAKLLRGLPTSADVIQGPGDDCAVIGKPRDKRWQLLKTDCVIEGIHFHPGEEAAKIGWKALARPLSDIAAMAGRPAHALITLAISPDQDLKRATGIYTGLKKCASACGVTIVGGETARSPGPLFISVMVTGSVERRRCIFRSGGEPGDHLFVTGRLGGSLKGRHLAFKPRLDEAEWLARNFRLHAMMDLSDGLAADLPRMASASQCGFQLVETALPLNPGCAARNAMCDGEDYELLFALPPSEAARLCLRWSRMFPKTPLTAIGELSEPAPARRAAGAKRNALYGYDHFA